MSNNNNNNNNIETKQHRYLCTPSTQTQTQMSVPKHNTNTLTVTVTPVADIHTNTSTTDHSESDSDMHALRTYASGSGILEVPTTKVHVNHNVRTSVSDKQQTSTSIARTLCLLTVFVTLRDVDIVTDIIFILYLFNNTGMLLFTFL